MSNDDDDDIGDNIGDNIDEVFALHHIVERQAVHMRLLAKALRFYADGGSDGGNKARSVFRRLEK